MSERSGPRVDKDKEGILRTANSAVVHTGVVVVDTARPGLRVSKTWLRRQERLHRIALPSGVHGARCDQVC
jgi:hypothetical protein